MKHITIPPYLSLLFLLFMTNFTRPANIIFDLGDVLIETKYLQSMLQIGPVKMFSYAVTLQNPFSIHEKLFDFLDSLEPRTPQDLMVTDHHGHAIPLLMQAWLKGELSYQELLAIVDKNLDRISSYPERILVESLAQTIFNPESFAATRFIIPEGIELIEQCKKAGHKIYTLSNWDPRSFTHLQELYPEFFDLFDGIIISGDVDLLKPDPAIYRYLLNRYDLKADECIFIDDLAANIAAAQALGIKGIIYCKNQGLFFNTPGFDRVRDQINEILTSKNPAIPINNNR